MDFGDDQYGYHDQDCELNRHCALCMLPAVTLYILRGLDATDHTIDRHYTLDNYMNPGEKFVVFNGFYGGIMTWDYDTNEIEIKKGNTTLARSKSRLPFGLLDMQKRMKVHRLFNTI